MTHTILVLVSAGLEVAGTFFLAVEAIKLHNLRVLRTRFMERPILWINPVSRSLQAKRTGIDPPAAYVLALAGVGLLTIWGLLALKGYSPFTLWAWYRSFLPLPILTGILGILLVVPIAMLGLLLCALVGSFVVQVISVPVLFAIALLESVEKHTATGVVGILGFTLFCLGAVLRTYFELTSGAR